MVCNDTLLSNVPLGIFYICHGSVYIIPYILCIKVMYQSIRSHACYKIMIAMGFVDLSGLFVACILSGILSCVGLKYCPGTYYIGKLAGALTAGCWMSYCALAVSLAFIRYMETVGIGGRHFGGQRAWLWVAGSLSYGGFMFSFYMTPWGWGVYRADYGQIILVDTLSMAPALNNFVVPIIIGTVYLLLVLKHFQLVALNEGEHSEESTELLRSIMATATAISVMTCVCSVSYVVIPPLVQHSSPYLMTAAQILYQACHGSNCIIYLTLNSNMRRAVKDMIWPPTRVQPVRSPQPSASRRGSARKSEQLEEL